MTYLLTLNGLKINHQTTKVRIVPVFGVDCFRTLAEL